MEAKRRGLASAFRKGSPASESEPLGGVHEGARPLATYITSW
jgi:hypothetical protein